MIYLLYGVEILGYIMIFVNSLGYTFLTSKLYQLKLGFVIPLCNFITFLFYFPSLAYGLFLKLINDTGEYIHLKYLFVYIGVWILYHIVMAPFFFKSWKNKQELDLIGDKEAIEERRKEKKREQIERANALVDSMMSKDLENKNNDSENKE